MANSNWLLPTLRGVSIALILSVILLLGTIYDTEIFKIYSVFGLLGQLRDLLSFLIYIIVFYIIYGLGMGIGAVFSMLVSGFDYYHFGSSFTTIVENLVGGWFYLPNPTDGSTMIAPTINEAIAGMGLVFLEIRSDIYLIILQILVAAMFYYAIRASMTNNPTASIKTITIINVIIIIPLFFYHLDSVLSIFVPSGSIPLLVSIFEHDLLKDAIFENISTMNFLEFITSEIFLVAVSMFVYLEMVFQVSYIDKVTAPSIEREERLSRQIEVMRVESQKAIARIKAMEEKKREKKIFEQARMSQEEYEAEKEKKKQLSLRSMMSEKGSTGFSFISELITKKKAQKEEERMMVAMQDTRKVSNYLEKLFKQDPEAKNTLTAKTAAPTSGNLIYSTLINVFSRIILISLITWVCVHPHDIFSLLSPDAIANSVEVLTYEGVLSILIPLLLLIPFISTIIKATKHSKLQEILRLEELRRSGLTEEELKELQEKRAKSALDETKFARDQDAVADQARKTAQKTQMGQNP